MGSDPEWKNSTAHDIIRLINKYVKSQRVGIPAPKLKWEPLLGDMDEQESATVFGYDFFVSRREDGKIKCEHNLHGEWDDEGIFSPDHEGFVGKARAKQAIFEHWLSIWNKEVGADVVPAEKWSEKQLREWKEMMLREVKANMPKEMVEEMLGIPAAEVKTWETDADKLREMGERFHKELAVSILFGNKPDDSVPKWEDVPSIQEEPGGEFMGHNFAIGESGGRWHVFDNRRFVCYADNESQAKFIRGSMIRSIIAPGDYTWSEEKIRGMKERWALNQPIPAADPKILEDGIIRMINSIGDRMRVCEDERAKLNDFIVYSALQNIIYEYRSGGKQNG